jgi:hypothetical protein
MEKKITQLTENLKQVCTLKHELDNPEYWINKAKEETDFIPAEGDWISVEVTLYKIEINVYHKQGSKGGVHWINGKWFNTSFPKDYPYLY